jgi:uncharacterized protein with HEPN domain
MSRDDAIVLDILRAAQLATEFAGTLDKQAFSNDLHQYDDVDIAEVWKTVRIEVPRLKVQLQALAPKKP